MSYDFSGIATALKMKTAKAAEDYLRGLIVKTPKGQDCIQVQETFENGKLRHFIVDGDNFRSLEVILRNNKHGNWKLIEKPAEPAKEPEEKTDKPKAGK